MLVDASLAAELKDAKIGMERVDDTWNVIVREKNSAETIYSLATVRPETILGDTGYVSIFRMISMDFGYDEMFAVIPW